MKPIVFVSHVHSEREVAEWVKDGIARLLLGGVEFFVSSDRSSIIGGDRWLNKIEDAIGRAAVMLVLCSPQSVKSQWVNFEAGGAWMARKRVIPLCHQGMVPTDLPEPLRSLQAYQLSKPEDLRDLVSLLAQEADLNAPSFDPSVLSQSLPTTHRSAPEPEQLLPGGSRVTAIAVASTARAEWIRSHVIGFLADKDELHLRYIHEQLEPPLTDSEKAQVVELLVAESRSSGEAALRFLSLLHAYNLVAYLKLDFDGHGYYEPTNGDCLLSRVVELAASDDVKLRKEASFALRSFGTSYSIPISQSATISLGRTLLRLAMDPEARVARWGLPALGDRAWQIPSSLHAECRVLLEDRRLDPDPEIRGAATWCLGHAGPFYENDKLRLLRMLLEQLGDRNPRVMDQALIALDATYILHDSSSGEIEQSLFAKLADLAGSAGGNRLQRIGSIVDKLGLRLPEPAATRFEEGRRERQALELEMRQTKHDGA